MRVEERSESAHHAGSPAPPPPAPLAGGEGRNDVRARAARLCLGTRCLRGSASIPAALNLVATKMTCSLHQRRSKDFGNPDAEIIIQHEDFSARHEAPIDEDVDRIAGQLVKRHDRSLS